MSETKKPGGGAAVAEPPSIDERTPAHEFKETDLVTVLHGWGRLHPKEKHYVDKVLFEGGVARNVPWPVARHWLHGTRPQPNPQRTYEQHGRVIVQVLPNDADEGDFIRATGIQPMAPERLAAMISAADLDAVFEALGAEKALALALGLQQRIGTMGSNKEK